jgi:hypothetical protein
MGYTRSSFLTDSKQWSTAGTNSIKDLNKSNIRDELAEYTDNLIEYIAHLLAPMFCLLTILNSKLTILNSSGS